MRHPMRWRWCEVRNQGSGKPALVLHGELQEWFEAQGLVAHLSLSDESDYAVSFCLVEKR